MVVASEEWRRLSRAKRVPALPDLLDDDAFGDFVRKLSGYFIEAVDKPQTVEQLRDGRSLDPLVHYLSAQIQYRGVVSSLLALKGYFAALDPEDDRSINETRGFACEVVAWRFVVQLSGRDVLDFLTYELPARETAQAEHEDSESEIGVHAQGVATEHTRLLDNRRRASARRSVSSVYLETDSEDSTQDTEDATSTFEALNALEVAAVTGAKFFLSQRVIQNTINGIWTGDIIFWETLSVSSVKQAKMYNKTRADPYSRLRVPRYMKAFEVLFFAALLSLYYAVLVQYHHDHISITEILLYVFLAGFAYDEFGEYRDAGQAFYATGFWSLWDLGIVLVGVAFLLLRVIGLAKASASIIDISFDILSLEALLLVPRIFSLLSLNSYFGTLIPCLKEMTKDFIKFVSLIVILYLGFLSTFTLLARDQFTLSEMSWILINVFFGSSYLGFDVAHKISPILGPPLMVVFVCMTNILLVTSLISLLSNSLTKVIDHAREEYIFVYSVYVLEASTSNRLTYYMPPLNLLPLFLRPLRLFVSSETIRSARIVLLKLTHFPFVAAIWAYENGVEHLARRGFQRPAALSFLGAPGPTLSARRSRLRAPLDSPARPRSAATPRRASEDVSGRRRSPADGCESHDDLKSLVITLGERIDELAAKIERQHEPRRTGAGDGRSGDRH